MGGDRLGQRVVDLPRGRHRLRGILDHFHARRGIRQDLHIDAVGIHVRQPQFGQIVQPPEPLLFDRLRHGHALTDRFLLPDGSGNGERLFHGHDAHLFLLLSVPTVLRAADRRGGAAAGRCLGCQRGRPRDQAADHGGSSGSGGRGDESSPGGLGGGLGGWSHGLEGTFVGHVHSSSMVAWVVVGTYQCLVRSAKVRVVSSGEVRWHSEPPPPDRVGGHGVGWLQPARTIGRPPPATGSEAVRHLGPGAKPVNDRPRDGVDTGTRSARIRSSPPVS